MQLQDGSRQFRVKDHKAKVPTGIFVQSLGGIASMQLFTEFLPWLYIYHTRLEEPRKSFNNKF